MGWPTSVGMRVARLRRNQWLPRVALRTHELERDARPAADEQIPVNKKAPANHRGGMPAYVPTAKREIVEKAAGFGLPTSTFAGSFRFALVPFPASRRRSR